MALNLSDHNCTGCFKRFEYSEITIVVDPDNNRFDRYCDKCLDKFKEMTKDKKVCVEVDTEGSLLYCYRCELKTKDRELFMKHDCIKTEANIKFLESIIDGDKNE